MILKLLQIIFFVIIAYMVIGLFKLIFHVGKSAGQINRKMDEMKNKGASGRKGKNDDRVIELDKDQYKVE